MTEEELEDIELYGNDHFIDRKPYHPWVGYITEEHIEDGF
jgi:hypothetical protein